MSVTEVDILILGAGPAGLTAAWRLAGIGGASWALLEAEPDVGGLSGSFIDEHGFTWDMGGHVFFSEQPEFGTLMDGLMPGEMAQRQRRAQVWFEGRWVDFPFQNHLDQLPPEYEGRCRIDAEAAKGGREGQCFADWSCDTYGESLAEIFFHPFNAKLWQVPLSELGSDWVSGRLAPPQAGEDPGAWGANNTYRYPLRGGCGEPFRRMALKLGLGLRLENEVIRLDLAGREAQTEHGFWRYKKLISTLPLDKLVSLMARAAPPRVRAAAKSLRANAMWLVGLGYDARTPAKAGSWMYFPQPELPFQRVTNMAAHSPGNLPGGDPGRQSAWLAEVPVERGCEVDQIELMKCVHRELLNLGLVPRGARPVGGFRRYLPRAYPVPATDRDAALAVIHPWLESQGVLSRGRFGGWCYEIGNMDHAVIMGLQAAEAVALGRREELWSSQWSRINR